MAAILRIIGNHMTVILVLALFVSFLTIDAIKTRKQKVEIKK